MRKFTVYSSGFSLLSSLLVFSLLLVFLSGCETPEKVLKSNNLMYKEAKAREWYNKKEYFKCIPVLEELIGLMKGRQSVEELYYMYCMANYNQGDYMISAYHFKNYYDQYTTSERAEECLYMYAKSYQMLSPKPDLDQTYTYKALEAYAFFLSMYPDNKYVKETNDAVQKLRRKLEKKALSNAELYYKTGNYKAAATCYENLLIDYPDIDESEKVSFMIIKSNFKYAGNSIPTRKAERFDHVIESYKDFQYKFGASKYLEEAKKYEVQSHFLAVKGAFEGADYTPLADREHAYLVAFNEVKKHESAISDEKQKKTMANWVEKGYFSIIKSYYQLSEEKKAKEKLVPLQKTVKTYYTFVDLFPKSRYLREAEKVFNNAQEQIQKLNSNG